jgi:pimeloyl-ACP methyl ester carboxylesterase
MTALSIVIVLAAALGAHTPLDTAPAGHWEGAIVLPGQELQVRIDLERDVATAWRGTIDIPQQGATGLGLEGITVAGDSVTFLIAGVPGGPTFRGVVADSTIAGSFSQNGMTFPFRLARAVKAETERPQTPRPPFPYSERGVTYEGGGVTLAGSLTIPEGEGPFPAVLLVTGSGPQDRDETIYGHKPFAVLADHLARRGIAVLRSDDRGVGGSTGQTMQSTTADFAVDALAGVRLLRGRPEIDPGRVGIIGHSEGGLVAPLVAAAAPDELAFAVLLAGPGVPLPEVLERQVAANLEAAGMDSASIALEVATTSRIMDLLVAGVPDDELLAGVEQAIRDRFTAAGMAADSTLVAQTAEAQAGSFMNPWFRYAVRIDPRDALRRTACPVLALNGGLDLQVLADQNLPEVEKALAEGGNTDVTARVLPGLNHLFQPAVTGAVSEYAGIETTFAPEALEAITTWITARFGAP